MAQFQLKAQQAESFDNPLVWPIFTLLKEQPSGWKVHTLASRLSELNYIPVLDENSEKDLFKRNFLLMNALYQLQEILLPENQWLYVDAMNIHLEFIRTSHLFMIDESDPLRLYYCNWSHYEASSGEVKRLLNQFWSRFQRHIGGDTHTSLNRREALARFKLPDDASASDIRKTWRRLALRWHPDRENGDAEQFRVLCEAWQILRDER